MYWEAGLREAGRVSFKRISLQLCCVPALQTSSVKQTLPCSWSPEGATILKQRINFGAQIPGGGQYDSGVLGMVVWEAGLIEAGH